MKRWLFIGIVLLVWILLASNAFTATYDASGIWTYSTSNNWVNPGTAGCTAKEDETATATITQTGDCLTCRFHGATGTGSVSDASYTFSVSYPEFGGTTTVNIASTLSSSTSGSGTVTWSWTDGTNSCDGGSDLSVTKQADSAVQVSSTNPANCATDVAVDTVITVTFSTKVDLSTIDLDTLLLNDGTSNVNIISLEMVGPTGTFTPTTDLDYDTTYTAIITAGVKDLFGNTLEADYPWSFTTQTQQAEKPDLIATKFESLSPQTEGDNHYVEVTCNNWGNGSADASHMDIFLSTDNDLDTSDDYYVGKESVAQIATNGSVTVRFDYTMPDLGSGTYNLWPVAIVDCDDEIDETDETNNKATTENPFKGQDRTGGDEGDNGDDGGGGCFISVINGN